jgi:dephospho-CoA kinase
LTAKLLLAEAVETLRAAPGLVVLMCGVAGSGKTTFAKLLERKGFARLSIDEEVWSGSGRFGLDSDAADYPRHLEAARGRLRRRLIELM